MVALIKVVLFVTTCFGPAFIGGMMFEHNAALGTCIALLSPAILFCVSFATMDAEGRL
jgi:hypothetical protein